MKNNKNWKWFIIVLISMSVVFLIVIWSIPIFTLIAKIFFTIFIPILALFAVLTSLTERKSSKYFKYNIGSKKYESLNDIETWNKLKRKYLITSIFASFSSLISIILIGPILYFVVLNPNNETIQNIWTSPVFILFIFTIILGVMTFIILLINRFYLNQIFISLEFAKDLKLKNMKWSFENKIRFYVFIYLHMSIISGLLAIMIYKDIEDKIIKENTIIKSDIL